MVLFGYSFGYRFYESGMLGCAGLAYSLRSKLGKHSPKLFKRYGDFDAIGCLSGVQVDFGSAGVGSHRVL